MRSMVFIALCLGLALGEGCGTSPTENHKILNDLNYDAGRKLAANADPAVAQTGADVRDNSDVLAKTLIGWPMERVLYDAALAARVRAATLKEAEENLPWYKKYAGYLLTGTTILLTAAGFAARYFPATAPIMAIATPIIQALSNLKQKADAEPDDKVHIDEIQATITPLTQLPKVGGKISALLKDLHLEQAVHSPEAPDIQPATPQS